MKIKLLISIVFVIWYSDSFAWRLPPTYTTSPAFKEFMKSTSNESRVYQDCLKQQSRFEDCEIAKCLYATHKNRSVDYLKALNIFMNRCPDKQIKSSLEAKIRFWETESIEVGWDSEGPSVPAIENYKYSEEKNQDKRVAILKKRRIEIDDFRKNIVEKFNTEKIQLPEYKIDKNRIQKPDFKAEKSFYKFLERNPFATRNYLTCLKSQDLNDCERKLCYSITKMNKEFAYYKERKRFTCTSRTLTHLYSKKLDSWMYNDGSHPEDWDSEGMPDHVLKAKKDLESTK